MENKIILVILNWNSWRETLACLESIISNNYPNFEILLVDNNSADGSVEKFIEWANGQLQLVNDEVYLNSSEKQERRMSYRYYEIYDYVNGSLKELSSSSSGNDKSKFTIIQTGKNLGYAGGNNIGIKFAYDLDPNAYVLIINNDTILPVGFLEKTNDFTLNNKENQFSLIGFPAFNYFQPEEVEQYYLSNHLIKGPITVTEYPKSSENGFIDCNYIGGHAILISPFAPIRYMNEDYFLYYEDCDFCEQTIRAGGSIIVYLENPIFHRHSASVGENSPIQLYYSGRNSLYFMKKYRSPLIFGVFFIVKGARAFQKACNFLIKKDYRRARAVYYSFTHFLLGRRGKQWN